MFKPINDFMIVELDRASDSKISLPDTVKPDAGNVYIVKAVGPGVMMDNGQFWTPDVKAGDKVLIAGKIIEFSVYGEVILTARAGDVLAVSREESVFGNITGVTDN